MKEGVNLTDLLANQLQLVSAPAVGVFDLVLQWLRQGCRDQVSTSIFELSEPWSQHLDLLDDLVDLHGAKPNLLCFHGVSKVQLETTVNDPLPKRYHLLSMDHQIHQYHYYHDPWQQSPGVARFCLGLDLGGIIRLASRQALQFDDLLDDIIPRHIQFSL